MCFRRKKKKVEECVETTAVLEVEHAEPVHVEIEVAKSKEELDLERIEKIKAAIEDLKGHRVLLEDKKAALFAKLMESKKRGLPEPENQAREELVNCLSSLDCLNSMLMTLEIALLSRDLTEVRNKYLHTVGVLLDDIYGATRKEDEPEVVVTETTAETEVVVETEVAEEPKGKKKKKDKKAKKDKKRKKGKDAIVEEETLVEETASVTEPVVDIEPVTEPVVAAEEKSYSKIIDMSDEHDKKMSEILEMGDYAVTTSVDEVRRTDFDLMIDSMINAVEEKENPVRKHVIKLVPINK